LSQPKLIKKGKVNTIIGLIKAGKDSAVISSLTGTPLATIYKHSDAFNSGKKLDKDSIIQTFSSKAFGAEELCQLAGACLSPSTAPAPTAKSEEKVLNSTV